MLEVCQEGTNAGLDWVSLCLEQPPTSMKVWLRYRVTENLPRMPYECPGNEQKNVYLPPALRSAVVKVNVVLSPPPITVEAAITRASLGLT